MGWLKKRLPKKRWKRVCLYLLSGCVILLAADMVLVQYWRRVEIGYDTTRITGPLTAVGLPDYIAARNAEFSKGMTPENNAAPGLLQLIGTESLPPAWREEVMLELGASTKPLPSMMINHYAWIKAHVPATLPPTATSVADYQDQEDEAARHAPWRTGDHPERTAWLDSQNRALTQLHQVLQRERFYIPWATGTGKSLPQATVDVLLPWLGGLRSCNHLLMADAMRAAGEGDEAAFRRDAMDSLKLARLAAQGSTIIEYLVATAIEGEAWQTVAAGASTPGLFRGDSARDFLRETSAQSTFPNETLALNGERYFMLDSFCYAAKYGFDHFLDRGAPGAGEKVDAMHGVARLLLPVHYNASLRNTNHYFDKLIIADEQKSYAERVAAGHRVEDNLNAKRSMLSISDLLLSILSPSVTSTIKAGERSIIQRNLGQLSLALAAYHGAHGEYPSDLVALTPAVLDSLPADEFAGKESAFRYRREGTGYLLYSVGPDGKDDGGKARKTGVVGWDIVVRAGG